jgi:hypothetical protein
MSPDLATSTAAPLAFVTPLADLKAWADLPEKRRNETRVLLPALRSIHDLVGAGATLEAACAAVAATHRHKMRGLTTVSLRRKYNAYTLGGHHPSDKFAEGVVYAPGDWRILVKGFRGPSQQPDVFKREVKKAASANHLSMGESFQQLRERWAAGEDIPGYGTWIALYEKLYPSRPLPKVWPRGFFPTGWSVRNLRRYGPKRGSRLLALRGLAAAKKHFPSVPRDTSRLRPMELITIDDFELDCMAVFAGDANHKPQIGRVAGLLAIDVGTRRKLHWGLGQRMERHEEQPDGTMKTIRTGITRVDVQILIYTLFEKFGLPDYPVTILCENAAAAVSPELQLSIETLFGGRVRIERTGLIDHRNLTNGFTEKGGCPWEKGWIEAAFAKLWNILGAQRGYKGNNMRLNAPGDTDEKIRITKVLLGQGEKSLNLPPEKIAQLRLPFQSLAELERAFAWACTLADTRTGHAYRGFDQVNEFLLEEGGEPQPFNALALLPPAQQMQVQVVQRMESSVERWERLAAEVKFSAIERSVLAVFLLTPIRATYRDSAITFRHQKVVYTFVDPEGTELAGVQEGTDFLCYLNLGAPDQLHITQLNGARTGTLQRLGGKTGRVDITDKAALKAAAAVQATLINRALAENREMFADENAQLGDATAHNAAIVTTHKAETAGLTVAQKIERAMGAQAAVQAERKAVARAVQARANAISEDDVKDFLGAPAEKAPAPSAETDEASATATAEQAPEERLSDYT